MDGDLRSVVRRLGGDAIAYGLGGVASKGLTLLAVPVLTRVLSPESYGVLDFVTIVVGFLTAFIIAGTDSAQSFFFYHKADSAQDRRDTISATAQWRTLVGPVLLVVTIPTLWFGVEVLGSRSIWILVWAGLAAWIGAIAAGFADVCRLRFEPWRFVTLSTLASGGGTLLGLSIVLLTGQIYGYFSGAALGALLSLGAGAYLLRGSFSVRPIVTASIRRQVTFGAPLLPAALSVYVLNGADRYVLQVYRPAAELGVYGVAAKVAILVLLGVETFRKAFWPFAMEALQDAQRGPVVFRTGARIYAGAGAAMIVYLTWLAPFLVAVLGGDAYAEAGGLVAYLLWPSVLYGYYMLASGGIWKSEKTGVAAWLGLAAAAFNVLLNFLLVPSFGMKGAAIATVLAYAAWIVGTAIMSERYWPIGLGRARTVVIAMVCVGLQIMLMSSTMGAFSTAVFAHLGAFSVFALAWRKSELEGAWRWLMSRKEN